MKKLQCDVCKKDVQELGSTDAMTVYYHHSDGDSDDIYEFGCKVDLCPDCADAFNKYFRTHNFGNNLIPERYDSNSNDMELYKKIIEEGKKVVEK